jgi:AraC family transcriptional regulator of adaptative response / DNA-3-methyladenine glycosylase II
LRLAWRPPYDIEGVLGFLARRQVRGIEQVEGPVLRRTLAIERRGRRAEGWIEARFDPERHEVRLEVSPSLGPVLGAVIERLRHALDLDADPARIDPVLTRLPVPPRAGTRVAGAIDGFEVAVRVILGQQVSVAAACTLAARLVERLGTPLATPFPALTRVFPTPAALAAADPDELGGIGIVRQRANALRALAAAVAEGRLELHRGAPLEPTLAALRALPGVGEWTTQVIAMRALGWPDAWPGGDAALAKALGTRDPLALEARARPWRPWRAYAVMRLWQHQESP